MYLMTDGAGIEKLGEDLRKVLPDAEFQVEGGDLVLEIRVRPNPTDTGEYIIEYLPITVQGVTCPSCKTDDVQHGEPGDYECLSCGMIWEG